MLKRKVLVGFLVAALSIGSVLPVFASGEAFQGNGQNLYAQQQSVAKISKEKAKEISIQKIKEVFNADVNDKELEFYMDFMPDITGQNYNWNASWSKYDENQDKSYRVSVDANTGKVVAFGKYEHTYSEGKQKSTVNKEKAKEIAEKYINKINPAEFKEVKLMDLNSQADENYGYYFIYNRVVNGVEYAGDNINVEVDGKGNVTSYGFNWTENATFPSTEGIVSKEKAMEILKQNVEMKLEYMPYIPDVNTGKVQEAKLTYHPAYKNGSMVDAKEGKITSFGFMNTEEKPKNISDAKKEEIFKNAKSAEKLQKELDKNEATKIAKEKIKEAYNIDTDVNSLEFIEEENIKLWVGSFGKEQGDGAIIDGGSITIDATTGKIMGMSKDTFGINEDEVFTPKLTWDQAYDKAIDIIGKYYPEKIKEIKTEQIPQEMSYTYDGKTIPQRFVTFSFLRKVNEVEYPYNSIYVSIDVKTGEVESFGYAWEDSTQFPDAEKAISKEEAQKAFFDANELKLMYMPIDTNNDYMNPKYEIKLQYILDPKDINAGGYNIDALSGKSLDFNGK